MMPKVQVIDVRTKPSIPPISTILAALHPTRGITEIAPLTSQTIDDSVSSNIDSDERKLSRPDENEGARKLSFLDTFGLLGPLIVAVLLGCIVWTVWLITLSLAPNAAANYLMNTSELDDGQFWLIPDEWTCLQLFSVVGLVFVMISYIYTLLKVLVWRSQKNAIEKTIAGIVAYWTAATKKKASASLQTPFSHRAFSMSWKLYMQWKELSGIRGRNRKFWNVCLKIHDLVMLLLMLSDLLEAGSPTPIAYGFATLASLNSFFVAFEIVLSRCSALLEILLDSLFDFCATVIYPLSVLYYCSHNFHYDRAVYFINLEILPAGSFERRARMYANPAEIALVRTSFDSLRIVDCVDLFLRIGMNFAFSYRCKRIVEVLVEIADKNQRPDKRRLSSLIHLPDRTASVEKLLSVQRSVPRLFAIVFVVYSIGIFVLAHKATATSNAVCSHHPECVVFAYRWQNSELCPCRAIVDGNPAPKTYQEWMNPVDATNTITALSRAGTLETVQLINRKLTVLPDELRICYNLNFISLINCATEKLPPWVKEFRKLQYLQIEGKVDSENLANLEEDIFSDMPDLRYLQLGVHQRMLRLPSLDGAPSLRSIMFSRMYNLIEISPLTQQKMLERLELNSCRKLQSLPDLKYTESLRHLTILQGAELCCNGFLGTCDLTNPFCKNATCFENVSKRATPATLEAFQEFSDDVCQPYFGLSQIPTVESIQVCDGIPFRQCKLPGLKPNTHVVGMCYSHRMQVLACNPDPDKIKVRRRQIQDQVGTPCNPTEEAWLGCN